MALSFKDLSALACPQDGAPVTLHDDHLQCESCRRRYDAQAGIFDLLPEESKDPATPQGASLVRYQAHFSSRVARSWHEPIRRLAQRIGSGFLYKWATAAIEQQGQGGRLKVLDAGCGDGSLKYYLAGQHSYFGVDFSTRLLLRARRYHSGVFVRGDLQQLPLQNASFDTVVSLQALPYVNDPRRVMAEFARVLRPAGRLLLSVPNQRSTKYLKHGPPPGVERLWDYEGAAAMVRPFFYVDEISCRGLWVPVPRLQVHLGVTTPDVSGIALLIRASGPS